jgi:hypothetical protein
MSDSLSFGWFDSDSKMESFVMSDYASFNRNNIYGWSDGSSMKIESLSKI